MHKDENGYWRCGKRGCGWSSAPSAQAQLRSVLTEHGEPDDLPTEAEDAANLRCAAEIAYGFLWRYLGDDQVVHRARRTLLEQIGQEGQRRGIENCERVFGPLDVEAHLHKMP